MAIEFKWSVNKVKVAQDNLVIQVDLTVAATSGGNTESIAYTRNLVQSDAFTPFDQLTEQQILGWCFETEIITFKDKTSITKHLKNNGETQVTGQLERQLAQKQFEPILPWLLA